MKKLKIHRGFIDLLLVAFLLAVHGLISWALLFVAGKSTHGFVTWALPMSWGIFSGVLFLYIFRHDKVIRIARVLEEKEEAAEKRWLKHFAKSGKVASSLFIGLLAGPILGALTIQILLPRYKYKYLLIVIIQIVSTIFYVSISKGAFHIFN